MIRDAWAWLNRIAQRYAPEGTFRWHLVTWVGHGALAASFVGFFALLGACDGCYNFRWIGAGAGGGFYTVEEFRQRFIYDPPTTAPWWDSAMDVLAPWTVGIWLATV